MVGEAQRGFVLYVGRWIRKGRERREMAPMCHQNALECGNGAGNASGKKEFAESEGRVESEIY